MLCPRLACIVAALLASAVSAASFADPRPRTPPPAAGAAPREDVENDVASAVAAHLQRGDEARIARRWAEAIEAYEAAQRAAEAAQLDDDTRYRIVAELVVCEVARGEHARAGNRLHRYRDRKPHGQGSRPGSRPRLSRERHARLERAYDQIHKSAAKLLIFAEPPQADVLLDGEVIEPLVPKHEIKNYVHWMFVDPGMHEVRAQAAGHAAAGMTVTLVAGDLTTLDFHLEPRADAHLPVDGAGDAPRTPELRGPESEVNGRPEARRSPAAGPARRPAALADASEGRGHALRTLGTLDDSGGGIGVTPVLVLGMTPSMSAGASVDASRRWPELSLSAEARVLSSQTVALGAPIRAVAPRLQLAACGHRGPAYLCGLAGVGWLQVLEDPIIKEIEAQDPWSASLGLRPGVEWWFSRHIALRAFAEFHVVAGQPSVWVHHEKVWAGPAVAGAAGLGLLFPFAAR
jgi:hypothetical protein